MKLLFHAPLAAASLMNPLLQYPMSTPSLTFSQTWAVLGPFQIGTREAAWGADPLAYHGGFSALAPGRPETVPSSLVPNGEAGWSTVAANASTASQSATARLHVAFEHVDWAVLRGTYGWASAQWQAWARGELSAGGSDDDAPRSVELWVEGALEMRVGGRPVWGGDFFGFRRAPVVLWLAPGRHVVEVRLVREVRSMGGVDSVPAVDVALEAREAEGVLAVRDGSVLVSDIVDGRLPRPYATVSVTNVGVEWIQIADLACVDNTVEVQPGLRDDGSYSVQLAPGQTRPLPFRISLVDPAARTSSLEIRFKTTTQQTETQRASFALHFQHTSLHSPQKVTHPHPSGIVSYSILRPLSKNAACQNESSNAPVLLFLHGAGVEADSPVFRAAFDPLPDICAWVVCPSGVTSWSGDDWHTWGSADVANSVYFILPWIEAMGWSGPGVDMTKVLASGHSNGGQGVWYLLAHNPSRVIAAAPVSGYLSIQNYVPYTFWREMDPRKRGVLEAATTSFRHELLASNFAEIPIYQQHGSADDNVPVYHSRLMHQLVSEAGGSSNFSEVSGQGHWWDGVMTTPGLVKFYEAHLSDPKPPRLDDIDSFELVVSNPADMTGKFGIRVLYLEEPGQLGRLRVSRDKAKDAWRFQPENVMVFEINDDAIGSLVIDDGRDDALIFKGVPGNAHRVFTRLKNPDSSTWILNEAKDMPVRRPSQFGGLDAVLRTGDAFTIGYGNETELELAVQVSRNLYQYFAADSVIQTHGADNEQWGNLITLAVGAQLPSRVQEGFPIRVSEAGRLQVRDSDGYWGTPGGSRSKIGAIFLRPNVNPRCGGEPLPWGVELVVWGESPAMLAQAARLVPMLTGTGQPDFVILREDAKWKGVDGTYLGFFDAWWGVAKSSVLM